MIISIISAIAQNYVIGDKNRLLWHLPADMQHFREMTMGKPVIMGRKTFESIGKPLPGRENIIVTGETNYKPKGCKIAHSIDEAINLVKDQKEVMIIGGASLYKQMLPRADKLYLTLVHQEFTGDAYFPKFNWGEWDQIERVDHKADQNNSYSYSFVILQRK